MDHISVPLAQIRASLEVLHRGIVNHEACDPADIDAAVTTLSRAHEQVGGEARRSLRQLFAASRREARPEALPRFIEALSDHLGRAPHAAWPEQLALFDGLATDEDQHPHERHAQGNVAAVDRGARGAER